MDAEPSQAIPNPCPSYTHYSMTASTTSQTQTPQTNTHKRNSLTPQSSFNDTSPAHCEPTGSQSPDGRADIPAVKRRRVARNTSPALCEEKVGEHKAGEEKAGEEKAGEEKVGEGKVDTSGAEIDAMDAQTQEESSASESGAGTPGHTDRSLRRMPPRTLPLRTLFRRDGEGLPSAMQLGSQRPAKQHRPRSNTLNIPPIATFYPDSGHYHSDSEDSLFLRSPARRFSEVACRKREYELERERQDGYDADVEDEGVRYATEHCNDAGLVFGMLDSSDDGEENCSQDREGDVEMYMG